MSSRMLSAFPILPQFLHDASSSSIALYTLAGLGVALVLAYLYYYPYREYTLPYRNLPGPPSASLFWGNLASIIKAPPLGEHLVWQKIYGPTFRYTFLFGSPRFYTADPVALAYILQHSDLFWKTSQARRGLSEMLGNGVLVAEGHDHRRQRKVLNSAFSPAAIRDMVPMFFDKSYELRDKLLQLIEDESASASTTSPKPADVVQGSKKIDVMRYLAQATLDVIGVAGFDYDFKALSEPKNELAEAYREMFSVGQSITFMGIVQALVPGMRYIPTKRVRTMKSARAVTRRIGKQLVENKKRAIKASHSEGLEKGSDVGKDLLSILIKANLASDLKPDQRMSDDEVLAQITTFMLAGNETSSTALTWILYMLSQHPDRQDRLREELAAVEDDRLPMDALNALPYLDAVVRETLRLLAPAPSTIREAQQDVVIPLGTPVKGRDGTVMDSVKLDKGTVLFVPILLVNTSKEIWGPDAEEFNPERFLKHDSSLDATNQVPGVWGNLLTFLGGNRNCIGYRFALAEIKAVLFVLIRSFEFKELPSKPEIEKKASIVMRSRIVGEEEAGLQMPLLVRPLGA